MHWDRQKASKTRTRKWYWIWGNSPANQLTKHCVNRTANRKRRQEMILAADKTDWGTEKALGHGGGGGVAGGWNPGRRLAAEVSIAWPLTVSVCTSQVNYSLVVRLQHSSLEQRLINWLSNMTDETGDNDEVNGSCFGSEHSGLAAAGQ